MMLGGWAASLRASTTWGPTRGWSNRVRPPGEGDSQRGVGGLGWRSNYMSRSNLSRACLVALWVMQCSAPAAVPTADGLYAVIRVDRGASVLGEFVCRLDFDKVPRTVANFVGLAEGSWPFVDFKAGHVVRRPYYDGIKFHRVVPGFVIQGGSPNGLGTDGPGYTFPDEFHPSLRHGKAGILSMANSGLNSNGSQFFVTLAATAWLNDVHSVFGEVIEGLNVVTNVVQGDVMGRVTVVRHGTAANAFAVGAQGLPEAVDGAPSLVSGSNGWRLGYPQLPNTEVIVFHADTVDAAAWIRHGASEMHGPTPVVSARDVSGVANGKGAQFFEVARVRYPDPIHTPASLAQRKVTLTDTGGFVMAVSLTTTNSGTYVFTQGGSSLGPNPVAVYTWGREAYRGRWVAAISGLAYGNDPIVQLNVSLVSGSATQGTYGGSLATGSGQTVPMKGSFVIEEL